MSSVFLVLVLVSLQVFCDGAPGRVIPALRRFPWYAQQDEFQVDKRRVDENACLRAHNAKRAQHGASPLVWDDGLAKEAQDWANHLADIERMEHAQGTGEGENLYEIWITNKQDATCPNAVQAWYDEIKDYDFGDPGFSGATGHFTQVVWKGSKKVGVAVATASKPDAEGFYTSFVVARYFPQGNYMGQFAENVKA